MPRDPRCLVDPRTGESLRAREKPEYYPSFSTMSQRDFSHAATREVVIARAESVPTIRFFSPRELATAEAVFGRLHPQDDRVEWFKMPIVPVVDKRLYTRRGAGYRFDGTPDAPEAQKIALRAIDAMASELYGMPFHALPIALQETLLHSLRECEPLGAREHWEGLPVAHAWTLLVQDAVDAYSAHPWGLGRDRLRWPELSTWQYALGARGARTVGGRRDAP
jgi:Gluconate 2-dehydrogenase subunit 3